MPAKRLSMRKIKEVLRLKYEAKLSQRQIARSLKMGLGTVSMYIKRAETAGLRWPSAQEMDERKLAQALFDNHPPKHPPKFIEPDCAKMHQQLKHKGVTKLLLWEEYKQVHGEHGYQYSRFCHCYRRWLSQQKRSMRQHHRAGEKLFVDYCGPTVGIVNPDTGELRQAQIFVAVMGASNYTFATATWSQRQQDWIEAHIKTFEFLGGVPEVVVPDNLKSAVSKPDRYTPGLNPAYQQMASFYQTAIVPARPYKPKDKAKAEVAVQIVERWILAKLRHQTFFTLASLNQAIRELLKALNERAFKKLPGCRRSQFEQIDQPALKSLPKQPYQYVDVKQARVHIDYHIEYDKHYYSVPHHLVKQQVMIHASSSSISIYAYGKRIATHPRSMRQGKHSTCAEHMPNSHRSMHEWSPERFLGWAAEIGIHTRELVDHLLQKRRHKEQNYRQILALLSNAKKYGRDRLNNACARALQIQSPTRRSVESILKRGMDKIQAQPAQSNHPQEELFLDAHENVRGEKYYH